MDFARFLAALRRCKKLDQDMNASPLARVLNLFDLTLLGVGSTLGLGVYVLAGTVAKTIAGPAVILSFAVAAIASTFAGLCFAEFAARVPRAGSAYIYSYVSVGEFLGFTIGWNLILEYVISTAGMAKGTSNYIDSMTNNKMSKAMRSVAPINVSFLAKYPDFLAFGLVCLVTILLATGVRESSRFTSALTVINLFTILTVVITGSIKAKPSNWSIKVKDIPEKYKAKAGTGGFMPFGFSGVMAGAAKCFFGYVGYDALASTGEEAINPTKNIPLAIVITLFIIFVAYLSTSSVLTLMWPYYAQDADAPLIHVFNEMNMPAVKWLVAIGAITAICTNLVGSFFPLPRILYSMASDGLVFQPLKIVNPKTKTPIHATVASGLLAALLALMFNMDQLIDMLSIGTLLAYSLVAASVLVLRYGYQKPDTPQGQPPTQPGCRQVLMQNIMVVFNCIYPRVKEPNKLSSNIVKVTTALIFVVVLTMSAVATLAMNVPAVAVMGILMALLLLILVMQPGQSVAHLNFSVPLVPLVPYLSVCINMYLIVQLDWMTWVRFLIWMIVGYSIYFGYGMSHSVLKGTEPPPQANAPSGPDAPKAHKKHKERKRSSVHNAPSAPQPPPAPEPPAPELPAPEPEPEPRKPSGPNWDELN